MLMKLSISPMFYVQLLRSKVPKAPNDTADLTVFFAHSGSKNIKAASKTLMKLSPSLFLFLIVGQSYKTFRLFLGSNSMNLTELGPKISN